MNSDDLRFLSGGMLSSRSFATPISSRLLDALNNEFFKDGKIYCWMGSKEKDHRLVRIDEKLLVIDSLTNIRGISV
ncbi:MAG TPA: hypothetical protein VM553_22750, partial [Dongiaceae bacterium]|nr:hypothetical protein [Dongiaceae bacterium]